MRCQRYAMAFAPVVINGGSIHSYVQRNAMNCDILWMRLVVSKPNRSDALLYNAGNATM